MTVLHNILEIALEVAPWLLGGLLIAGLIKAWIPEARLARWLGGPGLGPIARGAVVGAPLPLCSCGAIPAGVTLHRGGASRGATTSFMVGTPGIGVDSVAMTYALIGPFMAIARPLGAVASAIATGLLVAGVPDRFSRKDKKDRASHDHCCDILPGTKSSKNTPHPEGTGSPSLAPSASLRRTRHRGMIEYKSRTESTTAYPPRGFASSQDTGWKSKTPCCEDSCRASETAVSDPPVKRPLALRRSADGVRYAFTKVLNDIGPWMLLGLVVAGVLVTWVPPEALADYGGGWTAMLLMAVIGIPLYLCAQAATPIAAAMIVAGVSPGTALVFLLAAPMTSLPTLAVLRKEFGLAPVLVFVVAIGATAITAGLAVDAATTFFSVNVAAQTGESMVLFGKPVEYLALIALFVLAVPPIQRRLFGNG